MFLHLLIVAIWSTSCLPGEHVMQSKKKFMLSGRDSDLDVLRSAVGGNVTLKLVSATQPTTLTCAKPGVDLSGSEIVWFFKPCGNGPSGQPCDWTSDAGVLQMCGAEQRCPLKLVLDRPLPGIYRCFETGHKSGYTMTATVINTYLVETIETKWGLKFVKVPQDVKATPGKSARFECQVRSPHPVHIKWYRQVDEKHPHAIKYEKKFYQVMNGTTTEMKNDSYWSLLEIKSVKSTDYGIFACGVVFEGGIQYKETHLMRPNGSAENNDELMNKFGETNFSYKQQAIYVGAGTSFVGLLILLRFHCCLCCCRSRPTHRRVTIATEKREHEPKREQQTKSMAWGRLGDEGSALKMTQATPARAPYPGWTTTEAETSDYERVVTTEYRIE